VPIVPTPAGFPVDALSAAYRRCVELAQPFVLSIGGELHALALPPDHDIILFNPPLELTPDVLRMVLG